MSKFWTIKALSSDEAEVLIYGDIGTEEGWDDVTAKGFAKELKDLGDIKNISIRINSPGGDVFVAQAIFSTLKRHSALKTVYIDGLAASSASIIAMVGNRVVMPSNSMMMVHNPWTWSVGESKDFRKLADNLDKVRESMLAVYVEKTGLETEEIIELLDAETWMTAKDALEKGFADEIEGVIEVAACASAITASSKKHFKKIPSELLAQKINKKEDKSPMEITKSMIASEHSEIYEQIKAEGVKEERERIKEIENLGVTDCSDVIERAKFETGEPAAEVAMKILKVQAKKKKEHLTNLKDDAAGLNNISTGALEGKSEDKAAMEASLKSGFEGRKK